MNKATYYKYIIHALFWAMFCCLAYRYTIYFLKLQKIDKSNSMVLLYSIMYVLLLMVPVYINYFVLLPRYFLSRKYVLYIFWWIVTVVAGSFIVCVLEDLYLRPEHPDWLYSNPHLYSRVPYIALFNFLTHFSFLFEELLRKQQQEAELTKAKTETELKWLKAQVNPHFLFNALNNIYSLAYRQSEETAPAVMKLSNMMRYMLEESTAGKISIQKEAAYLENYIQLQKLKKRYAKKINSEIVIANADLQIEPMLLINFVENAFKHNNLEEEGAWVKMKLTASSNSILFDMANTIAATETKDKTTGIGLENVKQRLALVYPQQHSLQIHEVDGVYLVHLNIHINT